MNVADLPLAKIFWSVFAVEASVVAAGLAFVLFGLKSGPYGGAVGAWLIVIPIVALAILGGVFFAAKAPWVRIGCLFFLLLPVITYLAGRVIAVLGRLR